MEDIYDVAVVGGGVIGSSILYTLSSNGYKCLLLEKCENLVAGASSGNSGMFHTGFDATPGTLEDELIAKSLPLMKAYMQKFNIPFRQIGAIMVAKDELQVQELENIFNNARKKGVTCMQLLSKDKVLELEPNLKEAMVEGGLLLEEEMVVDSCLYAVSLAHQAIRNGAKVYTGRQLLSATKLKEAWRLKTSIDGNSSNSENIFKSKIVINCSGLYGNNVDAIGIGKTHFRITPMKGEFVVYNKDAGRLINHIILPVPSPAYKGVLLFPSVYGNLVIGPTKIATTEKDNPFNSKHVIKSLVKYGQTAIKNLDQYKVTDTYAGIRPATQYDDYQIIPVTERNWITVGGIRSTGLTASLGIANYVNELLTSNFSVMPSLKLTGTTNPKASWWITSKPSYVLDGCEYAVTHKLMRVGLNGQNKAKL